MGSPTGTSQEGTSFHLDRKDMWGLSEEVIQLIDWESSSEVPKLGRHSTLARAVQMQPP